MFGQHLLELADSEQEILDAFACFDEHDEGVVDVGPLGGRSGDAGMIGQEGLRGWLRDYGDKMSEAEVSCRSRGGILCAHVPVFQLDRFFKGPFTDRQGKFDYVKFAKTLKVNDADEVEHQQRQQGD